MASQDWFEKDFYAVLGLSADADEAAIKKAYRKLAREWHPDAKPGDAVAEKRFKEIGEAYAVLSDAEERQQYDAIRSMASGGARFTAGGPGGTSGGGFEDVFSQMFGGGGSRGGQRAHFGGSAGGDIDLEELFSGLGGGARGGFGGQFGGPGHPGTRAPRRGQDIEARTSLSFRQAAEGAKVTLGTPSGGTITTRIPAGVKDGQTIRLRGKGHPAPAGGTAGDLMLKVNVTPHPVFGREGDHLTLDLPVTFAEAALGATVRVPTLDGGHVKVRVARGTPSGRVLRVKGKGIATAKGTGDLLAKVQVVVPQRLSDAATAAIEALRADEDGQDPRADLFSRAQQ